MKLVHWVVAAIALPIVIFGIGYLVQPTSAANTTATKYDSRYGRYIEMCSGLNLDTKDETTGLVGVANCLGRVRGFSDGHMISVQLERMAGNNIRQVWCVDPKETDKDVLESVLTWIEENPKEFDHIAKSIGGKLAALSITFKSLSAKYPCKAV